MKAHIVKKEIKIHAEPSAVWDALTNPEKTKKYFFHCKVHSTWKEGAAISFTGRMFFFWKIELKGKILKIEPEKLLQYTLHNRSKKGEETTSTVTDELSYKNGITTLSISDDVGLGEGVKKRYSKSVKGWDKVLKGLKNLVED